MNATTRNPEANNIDVTIYVPCYNEEKLVTATLDTIREATSFFDFTYEVLIYDDGSIDKTGEQAREYIERNGLADSFFVIRNEENQGLGINFVRAAERGRGSYFIMVSGDDSEPAETLRRVFNLMGKADVIIPYFDTRLFDMRFNGDCRSFFRRLLSISFAMLVRILSGLNVKYFNGCILHKRENILKYPINAHGLGYQPELICRILSEPQTSFLEVKVFNKDRDAGVTTAFRMKNIVSVAQSLWRILLTRRFSRHMAVSESRGPKHP